MSQVYEELERNLKEREECQLKVQATLKKLYDFWGEGITSKQLSEFNILEKLNELTDDKELKTEVLNGFIKLMRSKGVQCLLLEKTLAGRYLEKADQDLLSLSLYKLDYMHSLFHSLSDEKKIQELNKVYEKLSDMLIKAWGIKV